MLSGGSTPKLPTASASLCCERATGNFLTSTKLPCSSSSPGSRLRRRVYQSTAPLKTKTSARLLPPLGSEHTTSRVGGGQHSAGVCSTPPIAISDHGTPHTLLNQRFERRRRASEVRRA